MKFGQIKEKIAELKREKAPLTPEEVERFKGVLERIGTRKTAGFIYMCEVKDDAATPIDEETEKVPSDGLIFVNQFDQRNLILNLWDTLKLKSSDRMQLLLQMLKMTHKK